MVEPLAKDDGETLSQHVSRCINVAKRIIPSLPLSEDENFQLLNDVVLALALHDVGKAATGFQDVLTKKAKNWQHRRHEILSASFASAITSANEAIIFAVLTHHKSIPNDALQLERRALQRESIPLGEAESFKSWGKMKKEWFDNYESFLESWTRICNEIGREDLVHTKSLPSLRLDESWLERGASPYAQLRKQSYEDRRYFSLIRGLVMICDHMASGHYMPEMNGPSPVVTSEARLIEEMHQSPRAFQILMAKTKGSTILRAPTGSGKTEAALMWASTNAGKYSRLYYILPNIASINAMFERLKSVYGEKSVGLLHSRARATIYRS
ncbi:MAG: CRISPR-associated endonuclease Cas3'', partial [Nitrososphaerales archaeon]